MIVKLLTEHHLEFLSLKGGCRGSSETTLVKMSNCWKSHAAAQFLTSVDTYEPVQPPFELRTSKRCSVSSLTLIEYSSGEQRL